MMISKDTYGIQIAIVSSAYIDSTCRNTLSCVAGLFVQI